MTNLPFKSLDSAASAGPGDSKDLEGVYTNHMTIVSQTGDPSSVSVALEGSHDGVVWYRAATLSWTSVTGPSNHLHADFPFRYVRSNLVSVSGGTSPLISATIASYNRDTYLA